MNRPVPSTEALHLLRAILRECTYLPDPAARKYCRRYAAERFRARRDTPKPKNEKEKENWTFEEVKRQRHLLHGGRKWLSGLRRANDGHIRPLEKVLRITYGRTGRRKHGLWAPLLNIEAVNDPVLLEAQLTKPAKEALDPVLQSPRMKAYLQSQKAHDTSGLTNNQRRHLLKPDIPQKNAWGRPMPRKRVKNMMIDARNFIFEKVLPPLPIQDFERLRRLASGKERWEGPLKRRARPQSMESGEGQVLSGQVIVAGVPRRRPYQTTDDGPHRLTARLMKRLWQKIYEESTAMDYDTKAQKWITLRAEKKVPQYIIPADRVDAGSLFAGVGADGRVRRNGPFESGGALKDDMASSNPGAVGRDLSL